MLNVNARHRLRDCAQMDNTVQHSIEFQNVGDIESSSGKQNAKVGAFMDAVQRVGLIGSPKPNINLQVISTPTTLKWYEM